MQSRAIFIFESSGVLAIFLLSFFSSSFSSFSRSFCSYSSSIFFLFLFFFVNSTEIIFYNFRNFFFVAIFFLPSFLPSFFFFILEQINTFYFVNVLKSEVSRGHFGFTQETFKILNKNIPLGIIRTDRRFPLASLYTPNYIDFLFFFSS